MTLKQHYAIALTATAVLSLGIKEVMDRNCLEEPQGQEMGICDAIYDYDSIYAGK